MRIYIRTIGSWRWGQPVGILPLNMRVDGSHIGWRRILRRRIVGTVVFGRWWIGSRRILMIVSFDAVAFSCARPTE